MFGKNGRPLPAVTIAFGIGILTAAAGHPFMPGVLALLTLTVVLCALTRRILWLAAAVLLVFLLLGSFRYYAAMSSSSNDISRLAPAIVTVTGVVQSDVDVGMTSASGLPPTARCLLAVRRIDFPPLAMGNNPVSGKIALRLPLKRDSQESTIDPETSIQSLPHYGDLLTVHGKLELPTGLRDPGGTDYEAALARNGVRSMLMARHPQDWQVVQPQVSGNLLLRLAFTLRQSVIRHARSTFSSERAGVLEGLLLGARGDLQGSLNDSFERTGTAHLLATAGLHVGLILALLLATLRLVRVPRRPALILTMGALILYGIMAGGRPSVVRAVIVADVVLLGILLEREPDLPNALSLSALILLLIDPCSLFDAGFQLTYGTVVTILLLMPLAEGSIRRAGERVPAEWPGARRLRRSFQAIAACFFLAVTAQIGAAPLIAYHFNTLSIVSPIANTLIVPFVGLLLGLGFVAVALGAVHPLLAWPLDRVLNGLLGLATVAVRGCAAPTWASVPVVAPPVWFLFGYYAVIWWLAWNWQKEFSRQDSQQQSRMNSRTDSAVDHTMAALTPESSEAHASTR